MCKYFFMEFQSLVSDYQSLSLIFNCSVFSLNKIYLIKKTVKDQQRETTKFWAQKSRTIDIEN